MVRRRKTPMARRSFAGLLLLSLATPSEAVGRDLATTAFCRCNDDEIKSNRIDDRNIRILSSDVFPCHGKQKRGEVFPCPAERESKRRNLTRMANRRTNKDSSNNTPTAAPKAASTAGPTYPGFQEEPERAYRPKKQLPPTVSARPSRAPTFPLPTISPTLVPTSSPTGLPSPVPTAKPTDLIISLTRLPTPPTDSPTISPTTAPSLLIIAEEETETPTAAIVNQPTDNPWIVPRVTALPTTQPTNSPTPRPSAAVNVRTSSPTDSPWVPPRVTALPTVSPSESPTNNPTDAPTKSPTESPTKSPIGPLDQDDITASPTRAPVVPRVPPLDGDDVTSPPTSAPTEGIAERVPTGSPTRQPVAPIDTDEETNSPTQSPVTPNVPPLDGDDATAEPTIAPSVAPTTVAPTNRIIESSQSPSVVPSTVPSNVPSAGPSALASAAPSVITTGGPSHAPFATTAPSVLPSSAPSSKVPMPSASPSSSPSSRVLAPTGSPIKPLPAPTTTPSLAPTKIGVSDSMSPSAIPSVMPSVIPSIIPSIFPSWDESDTFGPTNSAWPTVGAMLWEEIPTDSLYTTTDGEVFGASMSVSDDGSVISVGAFMNSETNQDGGRIARIDLNNPAMYSEVRGSESAYLGYQVSASGDGNLLSSYDSNTGILSIHEFVTESSSFQTVGSVDPGVFPGSADFAMSRDGKWLAVIGEDFNEVTLVTRILVLLYEYDASTKAIEQYGEEVVFGTNESNDWGFFDIAINDDGKFVIVSQVGRGDFQGEIRTYERSQSGYIQKGPELSSDMVDDGFGQDVEVLSNDNDQLQIGFSVPYDDSVLIYTLEDSGEWLQIGSAIRGFDLLGTTGTEFGFDITFNDRGDRLVIGAPAYLDGAGAAQGYILSSNEWWPTGPTLTGADGSSFGEAVECDEDCSVLAVGAPLDCWGEDNCGGSVYVFRDTSTL